MSKAREGAIIILLYFLFFSYSGLSQSNYLDKPVQISMADTTVDALFDELSKQCQCFFSYNANLINGKSQASLHIDGNTLSQALDTLFQEHYNYQEYKNQIIISEPGNHSIEIAKQQDDYIVVSGTIRDSLSGNLIPYASVAMLGEYMGTVSNESGAFALKIPTSYEGHKLAISSIGYRNFNFHAHEGSFDIRLKPVTISLQEVLVRSVGALVLLRKSQASFNDNYRVKPYNYTAFYRESTQKNGEYLSYTEAYLEGRKYGINTSRDDKMELIKSRNFKNNNQVDTILIKLQGGIDACIRLDLIRNKPNFISDEAEQLYDFKLRDVNVWENQLVHVLSFQPKRDVLDALFKGELYIGLDDMAIVGADFSYAPERMHMIKKSLVLRKSAKIKAKPLNTQYTLKYSKQNGRYYIQHLRGEMNLKAKGRKQVRYAHFNTRLEMVVTKIDTISKQSLNRKELVKTHSIFSDQVQLTPSDFWGNDNVILPETNIVEAFQQSGFILEEKK